MKYIAKLLFLTTLLHVSLVYHSRALETSPVFNCFVREYTNDLDSKYTYLQNDSEIYADKRGDALEFIDLTRLNVNVDNDRITARISLAHLPKWFVFDRADVGERAAEYAWSVYFDVDGDDTWRNDIAVSISSYKFSGEEVSIGKLEGFVQRNVWQYNSQGSSSLTEYIDVSVEDQATIVMSVKKQQHKALSRITANTPVRFSTLYNIGKGVCEDFYPDIESTKR